MIRSWLFFLLASSSLAQDPTSPVDFERDVRPIFAEKCTLCHGPDDEKGGLRLTGIDFANRKLDSGNIAIVPGEPTASALIARIHANDPEEIMPPPGKAEPLTVDEKVLLERWVAEGATWPEHWAYTSLQRPKTPAVHTTAWMQSPLDAFVLATLERESIDPSPPADSITLIRRMFYDLAGLPPTVEQVAHYQNAFADGQETGVSKLADDLLASVHFGERWGRHWLDIARYADSDGYEKDNGRPNAWRFRDWVIDAINQDMPFDQFTIEQFAGDLLESPTPEQLLATAFNRQTLTNTEGGTDKEQWRVAAVMDRVETMGAAWMGLTLTCARCHTHKYDEITHHEYYQLFAYFNNGDETNTQMPPTPQALAAYEQAASAHEAKAGATSEKAPKKPEMTVRVLSERRGDRRATQVFRRGEFKQPTDQVQPDTLATLPPITHRTASTGDRLDLARWLVGGTNPLPPRVQVNHIWTHLFGAGLVTTLNDFGVRGERPSHPELLDWLAAELVAKGWSRKALIKTIILSATYQQASNHRPELLAIDPKNRLLGRQNRFRVEAEIVRDLALGAAGLLTREVGGPSVFPPIPDGVAAVNYNSAFKWQVSSGKDKYRRGIYTYFKRTAPHPNLTTFDCPDSNVTCVQRTRSNTPLAALITLNNDTFAEASRALARRVLTEKPLATDREERIKHAFQICLSRLPDDAEIAQLLSLLESAQAWYASHPNDARTFGGDDDAEVASITATVRVMFNLDEFLTRN